ncbi:hypothetical protein DNAM_300 [Pseudomonas phage BroderSalsa]|nr:hypothetical protein DNAM_300 [Pseudomonas phage BroderSalsa]
MTTQITSLEQGIEIALELYGRVRGVCPNHPVIAGGYPRDIDNGVQPKDIDVFVEIGANETEETADKLAEAFFGALGVPSRKLGRDDVGDDPAYPTYMIVYEAEDAHHGFPVQLIMTTDKHPLYFDIGLCDISIGARGGIHRQTSYRRDMEDNTLTIYAIQDPFLAKQGTLDGAPGEDFNVTMDRFVNHLERLKAKYPDRQVVLSSHLLRHDPRGIEVYDWLVAGGHIGNPRTFLQTQRPQPQGNDVRLEDRGENLQRAIWEVPAVDAERWAAEWRIHRDLARMEAQAAPVPRPAPVQPRPRPQPPFWIGNNLRRN